MKPLSDALDGWSPPRGGSPADPVVLLGAVWPEIVGDEVARCSHPVRLEAGTLTIVTRSSAWSQQLSLLSERVRSAIGVRLPAAGISELRFRVGKLPAPRRDAGAPAASVRRRRPRATRAPAADAAEALERFKESVMGRQRAKRAAGWKECRGCAALIAPDGAALCSLCANAQTRSRAGAAARLLFEAPWLGFRGTAALIEGLTPAEYGSIRRRLLASWWQSLEAARKAKRLSRDGRERAIASSYVVLQSGLPPDEIRPATVRNVLGDELHDLLYGTERRSENVQ